MLFRDPKRIYDLSNWRQIDCRRRVFCLGHGRDTDFVRPMRFARLDGPPIETGSGSGEFGELLGTDSSLSTGVVIGVSFAGLFALVLPLVAIFAWLTHHERRSQGVSRGHANPVIDLEMASPDQPALRVQIIAGSKIRCPTCRVCSESENVRPIFLDTPSSCLICLESYSSGLGALTCGHVLCLKCIGKIMVPPAPPDSVTLVVPPEETAEEGAEEEVAEDMATEADAYPVRHDWRDADG